MKDLLKLLLKQAENHLIFFQGGKACLCMQIREPIDAALCAHEEQSKAQVTYRQFG